MPIEMAGAQVGLNCCLILLRSKMPFPCPFAPEWRGVEVSHTQVRFADML